MEIESWWKNKLLKRLWKFSSRLGDLSIPLKKREKGSEFSRIWNYFVKLLLLYLIFLISSLSISENCLFVAYSEMMLMILIFSSFYGFFSILFKCWNYIFATTGIKELSTIPKFAKL